MSPCPMVRRSLVDLWLELVILWLVLVVLWLELVVLWLELVVLWLDLESPTLEYGAEAVITCEIFSWNWADLSL